MDPEECEFLAEEVPLQVIPNFTTEEPQEFFCGLVGPFEAGIPVELPLWMALYLRRRHKVKLVPPPWLTVDELKRMVYEEKNAPGFTKIHPHFFEISRILISKAAHDITEHDQMMPLVRDMWDHRTAKMRTLTTKFLGQTSQNHLRLDNITKLECCLARLFMNEVTYNIDRFTQFFNECAPANTQ
ncbi:unnamed protein product [Bursaphelenchus xylophilus]|uniref:GINS complex subunit 2 n=1 Tax=Bursaphelenchus xylophilus TaxID=6326 RepID=A0A1I7S0S1_BURXY|nr:unnamed protein product [Bursaphelenchus xylophilus]CAG9088328.1 unnamed protein product [Bursaphelenchus xylophilus]